MKQYDPRPEIELAVRTGFLSKPIWLEYFCENKKSWRNEKWAALVNRGFFRPHPASRGKDVIVPNAKNETVQKCSGDFIAPSPGLAVIDHDEIILRTFLRLERQLLLASAKFEAESKKEDLRNKRHFDPSDKTKYPDLLISLRGPRADLNLAIEIELSRKEPKRYRQIMMSYVSMRNVSAIIYVTDRDVIRNAVRAAIRDTYYPDWEKPVGFVSLKEWTNDPMTAAIEFAEETLNLEKIRNGETKMLKKA
jgi:hypothetical protein